MSYAIETYNRGSLKVAETKDGFGRFGTAAEAAARVVEITDREIHALQASRRAARRILKKAAEESPDV